MATLTATNNVSVMDVDTTFADGFSTLLCSGVTTTLNTDVSANFTLPYMSLGSKGKLVVVTSAATSTSLVVSYCESPDGVNYLTASALVSATISANGTTSGAVVATGGLIPTGRLTFTGTFTTATVSVYLVVYNR